MIRQVRSIFLSDVHLGTRPCQAANLLAVLKAYRSEYVFLLGDIVDLWAMRRAGVHWTPEQNTFVQKMLRRSRHGEKVLYIPGNHDESARSYAGTRFGNVTVVHEYVHIAADGRRYLLVHGDKFDQVTRHHRWVTVLGDAGYNLLVWLNGYLSRLRRASGRSGYWSLAGHVKHRVKSALVYVERFEDAVLRHVQERGLDGAVCGHIHWPALKQAGGLTYINCGDWVESCTAVVEHLDGRMELIHWNGVAPDSGVPAAMAGRMAEPRETAQA